MNKISIENKYIEIELHYFLAEVGIHFMDAKLHNEAEAYLIKAINRLNKYLEDDIEIVILPREEGGLIDNFRILIHNAQVHKFVWLIIGAMITAYFSGESELDRANKKMALLKSLQDCNLSLAQAQAIVGDDKELNNLLSNYYRAVSKEERVTRIATTTRNNWKSSDIVETDIDRSQFAEFITEVKDTIETKEVRTTIKIISPVLEPGMKIKWRGYYNDQVIEFKVMDEVFLTKVYGQKTSFGNGTLIFCQLHIEIKTIFADTGELLKVKKKYIVKKVFADNDDKATHWDENGQLKLF
ncbi:MAG: hypothetical protein ACRDDZ_08725 [Marinifilaceae bacterium]